MSYVNRDHYAAFLSTLENSFAMSDVSLIEVDADEDTEQTIITVTLDVYAPLAPVFTTGHDDDG